MYSGTTYDSCATHAVLSDRRYQLSYCTGHDDLVRDFFVPAMERSILYRRAAGYFTSAGLALAARGVASLASREGEMRLIVSPHLDPDDLETLQGALDRPEDALRSITARSLDEIEDAILADRLNALAWLAASGRLKLKLALRVDGEGRIGRGLYHEKIGIFTDTANGHVAFTGSSNETAGGLIENFESIDVFTSWDDAQGRVQAKIDHFEALWADRSPGVRVIEFSDASRDLLDRFRDPNGIPPGMGIKVGLPGQERAFAIPSWLDLRDYQKEAIRAWSKNGGKGILAMATGSGKTLTALSLATKVAEKNSPLVLIVVCPFLNLCKQWIREMAAFGLTPVPCYEGRHRWESAMEEGYQRLAAGLAKVHSLVVTNSTFQSAVFQALLRQHLGRAHHLIIADEVHNLGAEKIQQFLLDEIPLRVGLSATPERHHDPVGTQAVIDYFGDIQFDYPIDRAIADGRLCSYRYYPHLVTLTETEAEEYAELTSRLGRLLAGAEKNAEYGEAAKRLLIRRARLLAGAENKQPVLDQVVGSLTEKPSKAIFYCGDGRTTDSISEDDVRQIKAVANLLGTKHGLRVRNFTYEESPAEREEILRDLASGFLDAVVAIRCLDEGIDLPELRMGFLLASSTNPRQFVQRRGRLLRHAPGKDRAIIHDFIIQPPDLGGQFDDEAFNLERSFFERELKRIAEFCRTAENGPEAMALLTRFRQNYNLISQA
jgi:DNA phosphorothioation system restriction enzyme